MFGFRYIKTNPSTYVIQYRSGKIVREGAGLSFFCYAPTASLVAVPLESADVPFAFSEVTRDFQSVTVQGQVAYRVGEPKTLATLMNFTLKPDGKYVSEDPNKLPQRVINAVQVQIRTLLQRQTMEELLRGSDQMVQTVMTGLRRLDSLPSLGLTLVNLSILAVKPSPETARALEAEVREQILKRADDAVYVRRNAAIEQERAVKENELNTEIAVETKKRQIRETQMEAEKAVLEKRQQIQDQEMAGHIALEEKNRSLTTLRTENARQESDAKAYAMSALMKSVANTDPKVLQALSLGQSDPGAMIALAFQGLAENASKIGELNISPDLLRELTKRKPATEKA